MKTKTLLIFGVFLVSGTLSHETEENSRPKRSREFVSFITSLPDMLREFYDLWNVILREPTLDLTSAIFRSKEHEILGRISALNQDFRKLGQQVNRQYDEIVHTIMAALPQTVKTEIVLNELAKIIDKINTAHQEFTDYISSMEEANIVKFSPNATNQHNKSNGTIVETDTKPRRMKKDVDKFERETLTSFAYWSTGHGGDSIKTLLDDMHWIILPDNQIRTGLFDLLNSQYKVSKTKPITSLKRIRFIPRLIPRKQISVFLLLLLPLHPTSSFRGPKTRDNSENVSLRVTHFEMKKLFAAWLAIAALGMTKTESPHAERYRAPGHTELRELERFTSDTFAKLWSELSDSNNVNENVLSRSDLLNVFIDLNDNITEIEARINKNDFYVFAPIWVYAQTEADVQTLNSYYDTFRRLQDEVKSGKTPSDLAWTDLAETYLQNNKFGLVKITENLHHHVVDLDPTNLFETALQELGTVNCNRTITNMYGSPHQILYNLYNTVALADQKGFIMLQFSYMILKIYGKGDYIVESKRETSKFEERVTQKAEAIRNALSNADRSLYNCDPKTYVEGVTYARLTKLLQGYIENEVNFNGNQECWDNCAAYQYTVYKGCFKEQFCSKQEPCRGKVLECRYMDSDMEICKSSNPERRYDWVAYENGITLGNKGQCLRRNLFKVDSWWRYLFWHCSYCLCICDNGNHSGDRYFNMRSVVSDIANNKVITGLKIVKHNRIIHFQIQQGVLGPRGVVDKSTLSWKPVDDYTISDLSVQNGVDYHTMSWKDRTLDIDDAFGPDEHVLTGVRLRKLGSHLNLEVRVTPINFTTGTVFPEVHSLWISNDNTEVTHPKPRREIHLTNPDIPIRYHGHQLNSEHDNFIKFQASSFDHDVAQNTVPFFDTQSIKSDGTPLSGIGFIHRGKPGSGGFIALKLITYNFAHHI